jgi:hypothetical protein
MASFGYEKYEHSGNDQTDAYSKYEFKKGNDYISVFLGLNRLDYNDGIQVSLYKLAGVKRSIKDLANGNEVDLFFGYSEEEIDHSIERIKDYLTKILRTTSDF